jgi:hypothetical protein
LRPAGKLIGIDWLSNAHQDACRGDVVDEHTRTNIRAGHLAGLGAAHFSDEAHLRQLLAGAGFKLERLEHKVTQVAEPAAERLAWWNFVAVKP